MDRVNEEDAAIEIDINMWDSRRICIITFTWKINMKNDILIVLREYMSMIVSFTSTFTGGFTILII